MNYAKSTSGNSIYGVVMMVEWLKSVNIYMLKKIVQRTELVNDRIISFFHR